MYYTLNSMLPHLYNNRNTNQERPQTLYIEHHFLTLPKIHNDILEVHVVPWMQQWHVASGAGSGANISTHHMNLTGVAYMYSTDHAKLIREFFTLASD